MWKNAITLVENNTEIKLWVCETWKCLQTIKFVKDPTKPLRLHAAIDKTSSYLILNDMDNQDLYVVQMEKQVQGASTDKFASVIGFKSIAKFSLASPILSFCISDAATRRYKCGGISDAFLVEDMDEFDDEANNMFCVVLQMFFVQPKSVQKCNLMYQPNVQAEITEVNSSTCELSLTDGGSLTTISTNNSSKLTCFHFFTRFVFQGFRPAIKYVKG